MPARPSLHRRQLLLGLPALALLQPGLAQPQPVRSTPLPRTTEVVQIVDVSPGQLDVSRDFLIGARAAWQDFNARSGQRGRPVQHTVIEVDGSAASLLQALAHARSLPGCVALCGTCGDPSAAALDGLLQQAWPEIAHVAPWLHREPGNSAAQTFPIFASRHEQIGHALRSLSVIGVAELGTVYASPLEQALYQPEVERIATALRLRAIPFVPDSTLHRLGQQLTPQTPAILLFIGGTPELAQFSQGMEKQARQRYVIGLADVNLQTLNQLGQSRNTPVIATQVVPMVTAGLSIVRSYRETMARLFDEPPNPLSLAGYVGARYAQEVLRLLEPGASRAQVLQAFQQSSALDLGGFRVSFQAQRRVSAYVTQSMLSADGRILG